MKDFGQAPDMYTYAEKPFNTSNCYLNKFDKNGNVLWTKTFDGNYFASKSLCKTADGNYALLTLKVSGFYHTASFDENGVFQNTIKSPIDENSITVYKFDHNGSVIWSKTIDGILITGYQSKNFLSYTPLHIVSVQNTLFIQTPTSLFILNGNRNLIRSEKPFGSDCGTRAYGLTTYGDQAFSTGSYVAAGHYNFLSKYDGKGNITQRIPCDNMQNYPNSFAMNDGIVFLGWNHFSKTDMNNNLL